MDRTFQITVVSEDRGQRTELLTSVFCLLTSVFCLLAGCPGPKEEPIWENVKIGDLAPRHGNKPPSAQLLMTTSFNLHIFEIPAENIDKLDDVHKALYTKPLRFHSLHAFGANSFSVSFGQIRTWNEIYGSLLAAGGQIITKVSLMLAEGQAENIAIAGLDGPRILFFTSTYGSREGANIGPGILALRIKTQKVPGSRGVCNVTAYPVFSPPMIRGTIPQLDARVKLREFPFSAAAFGLKMSPGDFILLGPKEYISDQTALGGLFFSNPKGSLFLNETERKPLERKPAVRIFLLVCTRINY